MEARRLSSQWCELAVQWIFAALAVQGRRIADDLLENAEVFKVSLAARGAYSGCGLGSASIGFFRKTNHTVLFEYLEMAGEVAIGQITEVFQFNKTEAAGVSN
jgi:hypothetical protein